MLLTYKIKHNRDFSEELRKARKVAEFCIEHRTRNRALNLPPIQRSEPSDTHFPLSSSSHSPSSPSCLSSFSSFLSPSVSPLKTSNKSSSLSFTSSFSDPVSEIDSFSDPSSLFPGDVRHIGLNSTLSGQIIRKYSRNRELKSVKNVKIIIPSKSVKIDREEKTLLIPCLKLLLNYHFSSNFKKISQIEIDSIYAYVAVVFPEEEPGSTGHYIGVDRNTTGHIAVAADPESGKVWKLGKMRYHMHKKYENIKKRLRKKGRNKQLTAVEKREKNILKDQNHKISRKIVDIALYSGCGIKLENLKGIRKLYSKKRYKENSKRTKNSNTKEIRKENRNENKDTDQRLIRSKIKKSIQPDEYSLNSWSFRQLQQFIEYKARLRGVEVVYIDPHATSKNCSRCGHTGNRHGKQFECPHCGHVDHADVNAAFNIALTPKGIGQFPAERDAGKGSTDTPQKILERTSIGKRTASKKASPHFAWEVCQFLA